MPRPPRKYRRNGFIFLYKRSGITSRACLDEAITALRGKAGLEGILDPFASGLLIAAYGNATRFLSYFHTLPKRYRAQITFGSATTTDDLTGEITSRGEIGHLTAELLANCLRQFSGTSSQVPPIYSNVKIAGTRAHTLARAGSNFTLAAREVTVYEACMRPVHPPAIWELECTVSAGTYIRALARDIALAVGTVGHLSALERIAIGDITLQHCKKPAELTAEDLLPTDRGLFWLPQVNLDAAQARAIAQGQTIRFDSPGGLVRMYLSERFLGLGRSFGHVLKTERLLPRDEG